MPSQIGAVPTVLRRRWTRQRLDSTVMQLCARGRLDPLPLVTHVLPAERAAEAYELLDEPPADLLQVILDFRPEVPMRHPIRLAVQEQYLQGDTMIEKWEHAQRLGFDAIELRGAGEGRFAARLPELREAAAAGVPMPTVCVEMLHFVGDFDADRRADALAQMTAQLSVMAAIGGRLAMTPASYGMFSRRLPPFEPPRSEAEDDRGAGRGVRRAGRARRGGGRGHRAGAAEPLRGPHDQHPRPGRGAVRARSARRRSASPPTRTT